MSKRLQVILADQEMTYLKQSAQREKLSVGEFVRRAIRDRFLADAEYTKRMLEALEEALAYEPKAPAPPIEQMNAEIEQGYLNDLP
jgi:hypothetical protein